MSRPKPSIDEVNHLVNERISRDSVKADSHENEEAIEERLKVDGAERLLLKLAKTDIFALELCTDISRKNLAGLGLIVMITGVIAFLSASYTFTSMIFPRGPDGSVPISSMVLGALLAGIYACCIMVIDREIVSSIRSNWIMGIGRLIFAGVVSMAVSYPVKLLLFDGAIQQEIAKMVDEKNTPALQRIETKTNAWRANIAAKGADIQAQIDGARTVRQEQLALFARQSSTELGGPGKIAYGAQAEIARLDKTINELNTKKLALEREFPMSEKDLAEIEETKAQLKRLARNSQDLLTKWEASTRLTKAAEERGDHSYSLITGFVIAFFFFLEIMPIFIKISLGKSEYHYYLEARQNLNIQKIVSISNFYLRAMQDQEHPENFAKVPAEVTEWMHASMEDEKVPYRAPASWSSPPPEASVSSQSASPPPDGPVSGAATFEPPTGSASQAQDPPETPLNVSSAGNTASPGPDDTITEVPRAG